MAQVKRVLIGQQCRSSPRNNSLSMLNLFITLTFLFTGFCSVFCTGLLLSGEETYVTSYRCFGFFMQSSRETQLAKIKHQARKTHKSRSLNADFSIKYKYF